MKHDYLDKYSENNSLFQKLDPRIKIFVFLSLLLLVVSEPLGELLPFLFYGTAIFILISLGRIPLKFVLKRCLLVSPFIVLACLLLPLSFFEKGNIFNLYSWKTASFSISLFLKSYTAVILIVILTATDKFHRLLKAIGSLGMPQSLMAVSALMYRYIFILNDERLRTSRAWQSRAFGLRGIQRLKIMGNQTASIFLRGWDRAHFVYYSMQARGFDGKFSEVKNLKFGIIDFVFALVSLSFFGIIRIWI